MRNFDETKTCGYDCDCESLAAHEAAEEQSRREFLRSPGPPPASMSPESVERALTAMNRDRLRLIDEADQRMTRGRLCTSIAERDEWLRWADRGIEIGAEEAAALIRDVNLLLQMLRDREGR